MREPISFFVAGICRPAGSKRAFYIPKISRTVVVDACKGSKDWKADVRAAAIKVYKGQLWDCPLTLRITFYLQRPRNHFGTGKNASVLKPSAPAVPTTRPDALKLARAVEDALTGILYVDDALIVEERLSKRYGSAPGAQIELSEFA